MADLRKRRWIRFYGSHRARSRHSHVWSFEITAALKIQWLIWLAGRWWSKLGPQCNLEQGRKGSLGPEDLLGSICRLHNQDA